MKKSGLITMSILALIAMFSVSGCTSSEKNSGQPSEKGSSAATDEERQGWIADLNTAEKVIIAAPGTEEYLSDEEISAKFADLVTKVKDNKIDQEGCYYGIKSIISELHCAHMSIGSNSQDMAKEKCLGIRGQWFDDELRISGCTDDYRKYMGLKITEITGYPINEVIDKLATVYSWETDAGERSALDGPIWAEDLAYLGLLNENKDGADITVVDEQGKETSFTAKLATWGDLSNRLSDCFSDQNKMPLAYRNLAKGVNYCFEGDTANHSMYFLYKECADMTDYTLKQCFADMMQEVEADTGYSNLIIDVRWNGGGNRYLMQELLDQYKDKLNNMQITLITGKFTYSAAFQLIADCLERFNDVRIYGEKTGQAVHHYTEISETELPALNCTLDVPTVKDYDPILTKKYGDIKDGITPDVEVYQTYEDYLNGIDTIYEKIISDLNN